MPQFIAKGEAKSGHDDDVAETVAGSDSEDARVTLYDQMERHREQVERDYHAKFEQSNQSYKLSDKAVDQVMAKRRREADDARKDAEYARKMTKTPLGNRITLSKKPRKLNNDQATPSLAPRDKSPPLAQPDTSIKSSTGPAAEQPSTSLVGDYSSDSD